MAKDHWDIYKDMEAQMRERERKLADMLAQQAAPSMVIPSVGALIGEPIGIGSAAFGMTGLGSAKLEDTEDTVQSFVHDKKKIRCMEEDLKAVTGAEWYHSKGAYKKATFKEKLDREVHEWCEGVLDAV